MGIALAALAALGFLRLGPDVSRSEWRPWGIPTGHLRGVTPTVMEIFRFRVLLCKRSDSEEKKRRLHLRISWKHVLSLELYQMIPVLSIETKRSSKQYLTIIKQGVVGSHFLASGTTQQNRIFRSCKNVMWDSCTTECPEIYSEHQAAQDSPKLQPSNPPN